MNKAIELERKRGSGKIYKQIQIPNDPIFTKRFFDFICMQKIYISAITRDSDCYIVFTNINKKTVIQLLDFLNKEDEENDMYPLWGGGKLRKYIFV